ncbi:type III pantothenate kinase [Crenobacter cavernae]|uniref:Type III pantothenate kinase n=1 Tax=Crenobacter cavernae TaxID=2290923 RepID=A0ABY0FCR2_9NEIS|nr:type III pantothenate kinase [Crenobacter cavernae]RXZ43946.1 type III pantothenate kinase [Crenobacter cavernae]
MKLLIDAGNSRVKWALCEQGRIVEQGAVLHAELPSLAERWAKHPVTEAWGACVAGEEVKAGLEAASRHPVHWVTSEAARGGVRNHYRNVAEQGVDRWLAVLGARALHPDEDLVIALAGTALTVEALSADGDYLGGAILPGARLMLGALSHNTAQLKREPGAWHEFPDNTPDALATGAWDALAGAVERMRARLAEQTGRPSPRLLISGGDAPMLADCLTGPADLVDNLVLLGLMSVADCR